ncbi:uncharacterized protein PAC_11871 [Phialocephala subalpina]|uniref:Myb/SANT-like domain-containing protein n=1 Tax=Phialocephala subalpina TaxID=576137 RepID=A0A1L7XAC2_9HELO|nr:uncharacterized protein PAC_11871 [Phialocephala subalpina]
MTITSKGIPSRESHRLVTSAASGKSMFWAGTAILEMYRTARNLAALGLEPRMASESEHVASNSGQASLIADMSSVGSGQGSPESSISAATPDSTGPSPFSGTGSTAWIPKELFALLENIKKEINTGATFGAGYASDIWGNISDKIEDRYKNAEVCRSKWVQLTDQCKMFDVILGLPGFTWNPKNFRIVAKPYSRWDELEVSHPQVRRWGSSVRTPFPQFFYIFYIDMHATDRGLTVKNAFRLNSPPKQNDDPKPHAGARKRKRKSTEDLGSTKTPKGGGDGGSGDAGSGVGGLGNIGFGNNDFGGSGNPYFPVRSAHRV